MTIFQEVHLGLEICFYAFYDFYFFSFLFFSLGYVLGFRYD